jgi:hypothetical protein
MKNLRRKGQFSGQNLNLGLPEYEAGSTTFLVYLILVNDENIYSSFHSEYPDVKSNSHL